MTIMDDIIREGNPTLREAAKEVSLPLDGEDISSGKEMFESLKNSQDLIKVEELHSRGGVGLAAPQLDISKRIIVVHVPSPDPETDGPSLSTVMYNPKILGHSTQDACLGEGESCLSVGQEVPGYIIRHAKIIVPYYDMNGEKHKIRLKDYESIVVQHETDHINDVMFYDHINDQNPFALREGALVIE